MSVDPLDRFIAYTEGAVEASNSVTRPAQHRAADTPPYIPHRWVKGLLGGPMRCSRCKVRLDNATEKGCTS